MSDAVRRPGQGTALHVGQEAALHALVARAEEIEPIISEKGNHRLCSLFDDTRVLAYEAYVRTLGTPPVRTLGTPPERRDPGLADLAMDLAVAAARGGVARWLNGEEVGNSSAGSDAKELYRGCADLNTPALRAMLQRGSTIVEAVSGNAICDLYARACTASKAVAPKARRIDAANPDAPVGDYRESQQRALRAIDAWLAERT